EQRCRQHVAELADAAADVHRRVESELADRVDHESATARTPEPGEADARAQAPGVRRVIGAEPERLIDGRIVRRPAVEPIPFQTYAAKQLKSRRDAPHVSGREERVPLAPGARRVVERSRISGWMTSLEVAQRIELEGAELIRREILGVAVEPDVGVELEAVRLGRGCVRGHGADVLPGPAPD